MTWKLNSMQKLIQQQISPELEMSQKYFLVTEGATTRNGGIVRVKDKDEYLFIYDKRVAVVGDYVEYSDGSMASIVSGCGFALMIDDVPVAISQSVLDNDDVIDESGLLSKDCEICFSKGDQLPDGFLVKDWVFTKHN